MSPLVPDGVDLDVAPVLLGRDDRADALAHEPDVRDRYVGLDQHLLEAQPRRGKLWQEPRIVGERQRAQ